MSKKDLAAIAYISILVIAWGSVGSLIDYPLLQAKVYEVGSIGQILTFSISGIIFTIVGTLLFPYTISKLFPNKDT